MVIADPNSLLTDREREILELLVQGWNNTFICARISMKRKTLAKHIGEIYSKYNLNTTPTGPRHSRVSLILKYYSDPSHNIPSIDQWEEQDSL